MEIADCRKMNRSFGENPRLFNKIGHEFKDCVGYFVLFCKDEKLSKLVRMSLAVLVNSFCCKCFSLVFLFCFVKV